MKSTGIVPLATSGDSFHLFGRSSCTVLSTLGHEVPVSNVMANLLNAELPSDDEDDLDFDAVEEAKRIGEHDDEGGAKSKKKAASRKRGRIRGAGAIDVGMNDEEDEAESDEDAETLAEARKALKEQEANKAKAGDAWSVLAGLSGPSKVMNAGSKGKGEAARTKKAVTTDIDALCMGIAKKKKEQAKSKKGDTSWMRQMGISGGSSANKSTKAKVSAEEIAARAMAEVKEATAGSVLTNASGMITISETRRFAGKNITVEREVAKGSRDAKRALANPVGRKKEGLDAVLEQIAPAKKVTVMDKSKSDWKDFKTKDEHVLEELEAHKKSGATYLEKKDFLAAADVKQYEKERDLKLGADVRNRGRL